MSDPHTEDPHEPELKWIELARIGLVVFAAAAVRFRLWEPFPRFRCNWRACGLYRRLSHFQRGLREYCRAENDDGAFHDHRSTLRAGHRGIFHRAGHNCFRAGR